jgi:hypothetical protein
MIVFGFGSKGQAAKFPLNIFLDYAQGMVSHDVLY